MVAVFERIDLSVLETVLAAAAGESSLQMVSFTNQAQGTGRSVPDARIAASFAYWFEVKTTRDAVDPAQLTEHRKVLQAQPGADERLFVISPDPEPPPALGEIADRRVVWFSFRTLHEAIDAALQDPEAASDQSRFLLRELQALLEAEGLLDAHDVVVVAARIAYPEYLEHAAYVCQSGRAFRTGLTHLGFYTDKAIQRHVPRILHREDAVDFTEEEVVRRGTGTETDRRVARIIQSSLATGSRVEGGQYQVFLLSSNEDAETVVLARPVRNDTTTAGGRPWAWTLGHRYASLATLTAPGVSVTSDLDRR